MTNAWVVDLTNSYQADGQLANGFWVRAIVREGRREEEVKLRGEGFVKQVGLSREWKREGVMDEQSGETEEEEVMVEGIGE